MRSASSVLLLLLARAGALQLPVTRSRPERRVAALRLADTEGAGGGELLSFDTLSADYQTTVLRALEQRNKERILAGQSKYESVQGMVDAYMDFEGKANGLSVAQAEDEVVRYLQRRALLDEGGIEGDPQEIFTFGLLALLVGGIGYSLLFGEGVRAA